MAFFDSPGMDRALDRDEVVGGGVGDYLALLKPRVMSLVVFTALVGMVIAPGAIHPIIGLASLIAIAVGAGGAGALNMWYDADIDGLMRRTARRPIPAGRLAANDALAFGLILSVGSVTVLGLVANWLSAGLLAFAILFYVVVYTMWLKRATPHNIVIGGAAGALPPVIGWAAATDAVGAESLALFLLIFLWTPPHFWALSLYRADEYAQAGVPMLPVVAGPAATRRQILIYALVLAVVGLAPSIIGFAGFAYGAVAAVAGAVFVVLALRVLRSKQDAGGARAARGLFSYSLLYLFVLFAVLLAETIGGGGAA